MKKVKEAQAFGYPNEQIIRELQHEHSTLEGRARMIAATLAMDRNIYKKREALRAAEECRRAIDRIIDELQPKENPV
jgi:hypothetical protein